MGFTNNNVQTENWSVLVGRKLMLVVNHVQYLQLFCNFFYLYSICVLTHRYIALLRYQGLMVYGRPWFYINLYCYFKYLLFVQLLASRCAYGWCVCVYCGFRASYNSRSRHESRVFQTGLYIDSKGLNGQRFHHRLPRVFVMHFTMTTRPITNIGTCIFLFSCRRSEPKEFVDEWTKNWEAK